MVNRSRAKGTKAESDLVQWFHQQGERQVERHALHGTHDLGDINGVPSLVLSVKMRGQGKPLDFSGWLNGLAVMQNNVNARTPNLEKPTGLLVVRRTGYPDPGDWYAVQRMAEWWSLYRELLT